MTIPIACRRFKSPADTSPTVITVTPELDWIKADLAKQTSIFCSFYKMIKTDFLIIDHFLKFPFWQYNRFRLN